MKKLILVQLLFYVIEAKINAALDRMFAMGFNNKDGWLTKLLVEKGGDIGKVLDILQPF